MKAKKALTVIRWIWRILLLAVVLLVLLGSLYRIAAQRFFGQTAPTVLGFSSAVVLTGSMADAIQPDDVIITHRQDAYKVGDIVTYQTGTMSVTHRIIAVHENGYRTKGDANNTDDGADIPQDAVVGKVVLVIPKIGAVIRFVRTPAGDRPAAGAAGYHGLRAPQTTTIETLHMVKGAETWNNRQIKIKKQNFGFLFPPYCCISH